jgi:hypothetical protein
MTKPPKCTCGHAAGSHEYGVHACSACIRKALRIGTAEAVNSACYRYCPAPDKEKPE